MTIDDIKVQIKMSSSSALLAQASVIFDGVIETKGWRIMPSTKVHPRFQEPLWIQPPSYHVGNMYKPIVYIANKEIYSQVEEKIFNEYTRARRLTPPMNYQTLGKGVAE
jgi:DNA-binding cell septation regulator SpoVG